MATSTPEEYDLEVVWAKFDRARDAADRRYELDCIAAGTEKGRNQAIRKHEHALAKAREELDLARGIGR